MFYLAIHELFGVPLTRVIPALLSFPSLLLFPRFDVLLHITQTRSKATFTTSAHLTQYLLREKVCFGSKRWLVRERYYPAETGGREGRTGRGGHNIKYMNFKVSPITTLFKGLIVSGIVLKKNVMSDKMLIFSCSINEKLALGYFPISEGSRCRKSLGSRSLKFHQHSWVT